MGSQRAQRSNKFDLHRNFQSRSKCLILLKIFNLDVSISPTKNRAAVGGSLESFILDRNFQSRSNSRIFLIFGPSWNLSGFPQENRRFLLIQPFYWKFKPLEGADSAAENHRFCRREPEMFSETSKSQKNPRAHKNKIGTSPPPPKPPQKKGNFMEKMGFCCRKNAFFPGVHKIGAPISGPRIADTNFTDTRIFLKKALETTTAMKRRKILRNICSNRAVSSLSFRGGCISRPLHDAAKDVISRLLTRNCCSLAEVVSVIFASP